MNATSANGVTGLIIHTDGHYWFRVTDPVTGQFVDYAITHCDLNVTIDDEDAYFYPAGAIGNSGPVLDHSPETLGIVDK